MGLGRLRDQVETVRANATDNWKDHVVPYSGLQEINAHHTKGVALLPTKEAHTTLNGWEVRGRTSRGGSKGRVQGVRTPPPPSEMTCGFLIQLVMSGHQLVEPLLSGALPPKKNPGYAPAKVYYSIPL